MKEKIIARAKVQMTVEVESELWGEDCPLAQVYKQAADDGLGKIQKALAETKGQITMIGVPKIIAILTTRPA